MRISVFQGASPNDAVKIGDLHFEIPPGEGDHVAIGARLHVVQRAWHMPSALFAGTKFAVLVAEEEARTNRFPAATVAAVG